MSFCQRKVIVSFSPLAPVLPFPVGLFANATIGIKGQICIFIVARLRNESQHPQTEAPPVSSCGCYHVIRGSQWV